MTTDHTVKLQWESSAWMKTILNSTPSTVGIMLKGSVVMDNLANLPQAFCLLFGLIYALHLSHPKYMKNTFIFVQQVMLNLGRSELTPKNVCATPPDVNV